MKYVLIGFIIFLLFVACGVAWVAYLGRELRDYDHL